MKDLRGFLGLIGYYRRFVANYGAIAVLLTRLTKNGFIWTIEANNTFKALKRAMVSLPMLALLDFSIPFEIETDASGTGLDSVKPFPLRLGRSQSTKEGR